MSTTGESSYATGMLLNLLLIIDGTIAMVWFSTLTTENRQVFIDHGLRITTLILALPGVFWTAKIATNQEIHWQKRCILGPAVLLLIGLALPMAIEWKIEQFVPASLSDFEKAIAPH